MPSWWPCGEDDRGKPWSTQIKGRSLKKERIKKRIYENQALATGDVSGYVEEF